jgi:hypothetical protein
MPMQTQTSPCAQPDSPSTAHRRSCISSNSRPVALSHLALTDTQPATPAPARYSTIYVGNCKALGGLVAVKVYEEGALAARRRPRRMAAREAIVLKYLQSQGCARRRSWGRRWDAARVFYIQGSAPAQLRPQPGFLNTPATASPPCSPQHTHPSLFSAQRPQRPRPPQLVRDRRPVPPGDGVLRRRRPAGGAAAAPGARLPGGGGGGAGGGGALVAIGAG